MYFFHQFASLIIYIVLLVMADIPVTKRNFSILPPDQLCGTVWQLPSSHRRHGQDKTVLSGLVRVGSVDRIVDKSRLSMIENSETVLSSVEMR